MNRPFGTSLNRRAGNCAVGGGSPRGLGARCFKVRRFNIMYVFPLYRRRSSVRILSGGGGLMGVVGVRAAV